MASNSWKSMRPWIQIQEGYNIKKLARMQAYIDALSRECDNCWNVTPSNALDMSYNIYRGEHFDYDSQDMGVVN
jgi:hypothetical protein